MNRLSTIQRRGAILLALVCALTMAQAVPSRASAQEGHVVTWGDTLSEIADRYGLTIDQLVSLNGIDDPDLIIAGQFLALTTGSGETLQGGPQPADTESMDVDSAEVIAYDWTAAAAVEWGLVDSGELPPYFEQDLILDLLVDAARRYGWDPYLIMAQAWQESYWNQNELSWTGAIGVMQVMPNTAAEMESWYFGHEMNIWYSAYDNIEMGVAYLTVLYNETGSVDNALASYYQGWGSVQRDGLFPDTEEYVSRIWMFRDMFAAGDLP
jgi:hypothetical protein